MKSERIIKSSLMKVEEKKIKKIFGLDSEI